MLSGVYTSHPAAHTVKSHLACVYVAVCKFNMFNSTVYLPHVCLIM